MEVKFNSDPQMNRGWNRGGFKVPWTGNAGNAVWHSDIAESFKKIFNFQWAEGGYGTFGDIYQPLMSRQRGIEYFGGLYENVVLAFDLEDLSHIPLRVLELGESNADAPIEPHALNVTVRSSKVPHAEHWVELYDPYRFQRVRLSPAEFKELAERIVDDVNRTLEAVTKKAWSRVKHGDTPDDDRYDRLYRTGQAMPTAVALLMASMVAPKQVNFTKLVEIILWMPNRSIAWKVIQDLASSDSPGEIPLDKLDRLYT